MLKDADTVLTSRLGPRFTIPQAYAYRARSSTDCNGRRFSDLFEQFHDQGYVVFRSCTLQEKTLHSAYDVTMQKNTETIRQQDLWAHSKPISKLGNDVNTTNFMSYLYGGLRVEPFQTLNFARGTQQAVHSDVVHFHTLPVRGRMGAAWVALEDIHPDSGPLFVYPGSHKAGLWDYLGLGLPEDYNGTEYNRYENALESIVAQPNMRPTLLTPRRGETVIWINSLLHGGSARKNTKFTRASQVTHYFLGDNEVFWSPKSGRLKTRTEWVAFGNRRVSTGSRSR